MDSAPQGSRKRQSNGQSPPAKRGRSSLAQEHFRLMCLPAEIRRLILKNLLCSEEPIFFTNKGSMALSKRGDRIYRVKKGDNRNAKRQLFPEILATCRQLHQEGSELLFENTIGIRLCKPELTEDDLMELYDDDWDFYYKPHCEPIVLGNRYNPLEKKHIAIPSAVSTKIRRVHITLYGAILPDDGSNYLQLMEDALRLRPLLEQHPNWKAITVEIVDMPL